MRIVAWNANHNNRRRSFESNVRLLEPFHADILVISETQIPAGFASEYVRYVGGENGPGLAIVTRRGISLEPHAANSSAPALPRFRQPGRCRAPCPSGC